MRHLVALLHRYHKVFNSAWKHRAELDGPPRYDYEAHFLPSALALQETPVSPLPRVLAWLLMIFAGIALLWAVLGRVEIVSTAQGKIIANGYTKTVQPLETATVTAIYVRDGQYVKSGDRLVDLDATNPNADLALIKDDLLTARLDVARAQAFISAVQTSQPAAMQAIAGADAMRSMEERNRLVGELSEFHAKLAKLDAEIARHRAEINTTQKLIEKLYRTAPIAEQRASDYKNLLEKNFVSRHGYLEKEQAKIETEGDLAAQRARIAEIRAQLETTQRERAALSAETIRVHYDQLSEAQVKTRQLEQEQRKAEQHTRMMALTAPVDGVVQQLAIHTVGGVVTPAQALLAVVPMESSLELEALLENKDIGFVTAGQEAAVKLETFPFTKYGTIPAKVEFVSNDAATDEKRGLIYPVRIRLLRNTLRVENKTVHLTPGMAATVEIKTGSRRVIEYFLSPLLQYADESLRER